MLGLLARADVSVSSDWKLALVLTYLGILAALGVMVFIPIRLAKRRGHRQMELLGAAAVVWGAASAAVFLPTVTEQMKWSNEQTTLIESGYYDPQDTSAAPKWPWVASAMVAGAYAGLTVWSLSRRRVAPGDSRP